VYSSRGATGILTGRAQQSMIGAAQGQTKVEDKIKQLLRELGTAINESISGSDEVSRHIQKIRDEGYDLYVVLDATIGLNKQDDEEPPTAVVTEAPTTAVVRSDKSVQFRINVNDLALLRGLGIDPTRRVRTARRVEPLGE
jgi:hypothetical protein